MSTKTTNGKYNPTATKKSCVEPITGALSPVADVYAYVAIPKPTPMIMFFAIFLPFGATPSPNRNFCQIPNVDHPSPANTDAKTTAATDSSLIRKTVRSKYLNLLVFGIFFRA